MNSRLHLLLLLLAACAAVVLAASQFTLGPQFDLLGRLHPLLVHLPIGVLLLGLVLDVLSSRAKPLVSGQSAYLALLLGSWSAVLTVITGTLLAGSAAYDSIYLERHRWTGIILLALSVFLVIARSGQARLLVKALGGKLPRIVQCLILVFLLAAGHLGGSLTHGSEYLQTAIFGILGITKDETKLTGDQEIESVYSEFIQPVLDRKCVQCHGMAKAEGGLRLHSFEELSRGGTNGGVLVPGDSEASEMIHRTTMSIRDSKFMPPDGREPLTVGETELIRWWVQNGATLEFSLREGLSSEIPVSLRTYLNRLNPEAVEFAAGSRFPVGVSPPDPDALTALRERGAGVNFLSEEKIFLDVDFSLLDVKEAAEIAVLLNPIVDQTLWLNVAGVQVNSELLEVLGACRSLRRLHLERSSTTSEDLKSLTGLKELEYLNLYGTQVDDAAVDSIRELSSLKQVYLWQTEVSEAAVESLHAEKPGLAVDLGAEFTEPEE